MSEFMYKCSEIAENIIAARYIILYSVEDAIKFYTRLGFCDFAEFFEADKYTPAPESCSCLSVHANPVSAQ